MTITKFLIYQVQFKFDVVFPTHVLSYRPLFVREKGDVWSFLASNHHFHHLFFIKYEFSFPIKWFLPLQYGLSFVFPLFFLLSYHLPVTVCFITNLLQHVVVWSTISFFVGSHIGSSDGKFRSDRVIRSNNVHQYAADMES